ncbi:EipA family protein [Fulvimarina sp. 2208YS6-2-32]|uniref:EipA family protein n=1 Tax=Fulvimarina uroteuthidis TaxID=3098149 RepID=A0ABU5I242_9HYPH|nr:EipA family protein [Fulvimarina sp. 2208YS6-2-32]MDY8109417.1 EipA family protein [Fulvimarina sp. 2208YS6-2-32]
MFKATSHLAAIALGLTAAALAYQPDRAKAQYANNSQYGAPQAAPQQSGGDYSFDEVVRSGHQFFGATSGGLAQLMQQAIQSYGLPNGYILGEEGSGAFIGGVRFGEGVLYTKNAGKHRVFWQGPSIGLDVGGDGARTMMLVYDLPSVEALFGRYGGITGTAYLVGGFGMTGLKRENVMIVPIKTGLGARLGVNIGYLKLTPAPTWNPF